MAFWKDAFNVSYSPLRHNLRPSEHITALQLLFTVPSQQLPSHTPTATIVRKTFLDSTVIPKTWQLLTSNQV